MKALLPWCGLLAGLAAACGGDPEPVKSADDAAASERAAERAEDKADAAADKADAAAEKAEHEADQAK
jgi:hypothetical protein